MGTSRGLDVGEAVGRAAQHGRRGRAVRPDRCRHGGGCWCRAVESRVDSRRRVIVARRNRQTTRDQTRGSDGDQTDECSSGSPRSCRRGGVTDNVSETIPRMELIGRVCQRLAELVLEAHRSITSWRRRSRRDQRSHRPRPTTKEFSYLTFGEALVVVQHDRRALTERQHHERVADIVERQTSATNDRNRLLGDLAAGPLGAARRVVHHAALQVRARRVKCRPAAEYLDKGFVNDVLGKRTRSDDEKTRRTSRACSAR